MLMAASLLTLGVVGLLSPGTAVGAGSLDGNVIWVKAQTDGPCQPGRLNTTISSGVAINDTLPKLIDLVPGTGTTIGCIAMENSPGVLLIGDTIVGEQVTGNAELFFYSTVAARAAASMPSSSPNTQVSFDLTVANMAGQPDFPGNFPPSGTIFVGEELMAYSSLSGTQFHITKRGLNGSAPAHGMGELVRANNRLKLLLRDQPRYLGAPPLGGVAHGANSVVKSPHVYLICRGRLYQTGTAVTTRSRCYAILEPGYSPGAPFWPDIPPPMPMMGEPPYIPYPGPLLPLPAGYYHNISHGTLSGTNLHLETDIGTYACYPQIGNLIWIKVTTDLTIAKATYPPRHEDQGQYRVTTYVDACVTQAQIPAMGATDNPFNVGAGTNFSATIIDPRTDSDGDGCPDKDELGVDGTRGGLRDPYNKWDRYDVGGVGGSPTPDGIIDLPNDILNVILHFAPTGGPPYEVRFDRQPSALFGPAHWSRGGADGVIDLPNDILGVILQFHPGGCPSR